MKRSLLHTFLTRTFFDMLLALAFFLGVKTKMILKPMNTINMQIGCLSYDPFHPAY
jgi:hypothetical protein